MLRMITRLNIGGPAHHILTLTREFGPNFPTTLAAGQPARGEVEIDTSGIQITRLPLQRQVRPDQDFLAVARTARLLRKGRFAILDTHLAKAGAIGRLAAAAVQPSPLTIHTYHGHVFDGYFTSRIEAFFLKMERALARHTDALIAVSSEVRDQLLDLGVGHPSKWHVIPLGLDLDEFFEIDKPKGLFRKELGIEEEIPLLGVVSRIAPIKDHQTLLHALVGIPRAHLAVVGDGEDRPALQRLASHLGLADRVHFCGWRSDIPSVMSDLDIVALSSRNEGTPVSLIEASAASRPVVATDVGGVKSAIRNGYSGLLVPPTDARALAEALNKLIETPHLRASMGSNGRATVRKEFSRERMLDTTNALYTELTEARRKKA